MTKCSPRQDPVEFTHCLSLVSITLGVLLVAMGYLIPRDYVFNPDIPASEMEAIEDYYNRKAAALDVCIVTGTVFVGIGGLMISGIFMMMLIQGDLKECYGDNESDIEKCLSEDKSAYGSVSHGDVVEPSPQNSPGVNEGVMDRSLQRTSYATDY